MDVYTSWTYSHTSNAMDGCIFGNPKLNIPNGPWPQPKFDVKKNIFTPNMWLALTMAEVSESNWPKDGKAAYILDGEHNSPTLRGASSPPPTEALWLWPLCPILLVQRNIVRSMYKILVAKNIEYRFIMEDFGLHVKCSCLCKKTLYFISNLAKNLIIVL